jgi:hypothetical protein
MELKPIVFANGNNFLKGDTYINRTFMELKQKHFATKHKDINRLY